MDGGVLLLLRVCPLSALYLAATETESSVMSQVFVVVAAGSVLSFIIRELGQPSIASWVIQVRMISVSFENWKADHLAGPAPHAISLITTRGPTLGCSGPQTIRYYSSADCMRWRYHMCKGYEHVHVNRRGHPHWHNPCYHLHRPVDPF
jgi:hypothetical protein